MHLIRYGYDGAHDQVPALAELTFTLRLPQSFARLTVVAPGAAPTADLSVNGGEHQLTVRGAGLYTILHLTP